MLLLSNIPTTRCAPHLLFHTLEFYFQFIPGVSTQRAFKMKVSTILKLSLHGFRRSQYMCVVVGRPVRPCTESIPAPTYPPDNAEFASTPSRCQAGVQQEHLFQLNIQNFFTCPRIMFSILYLFYSSPIRVNNTTNKKDNLASLLSDYKTFLQVTDKYIFGKEDTRSSLTSFTKCLQVSY